MGMSMSGDFERPRLPKSASAFRTISEVADQLDVPQHVLRFWETRFAQIRPLKRAGGRRYYRPEDVELLRRIRGLLYQQGYTIKGVQKLLRDTPRERAEQQAAAAQVDEVLLGDEVGPADVDVAADPMAAPAPAPDTRRLDARQILGELIDELETIRGELARLKDTLR
jgi:DNA-binding transcriptional MerR regulator